jgi:hypothetical protein
LSLLNYVNNNHDKIITTAEVEMEYKKNRQKVILDTLSSIKPPNCGQLNIPSFLRESKKKQSSVLIKEKVNTLAKELVERTEKLLESPNRYDPVYKILQRLFKKETSCNLSRNKDIRFEIRELAKKRFMLGYPPRKPDDTSIVDPINWEWIIYCAKHNSKDIVIISRDTDYGQHHKDKSYLNDWLKQEFKARVSNKRSIIFTRLLSEGFKLAGISVSKEAEEAEENYLTSNEKLLENINAILNTNEFKRYLNELRHDIVNTNTSYFDDLINSTLFNNEKRIKINNINIPTNPKAKNKET